MSAQKKVLVTGACRGIGKAILKIFANEEHYLVGTATSAEGLKTKIKSGEHKVISSSFGKESITNFEVLSLSKNYSKLRCELITGRTHQIRVHVSQEGYPIVGDSKYGCRAIKNEQKKIKKFYLHSHVLKIPDLGVSFKVEEPEDFDILLKNDENF